MTGMTVNYITEPIPSAMGKGNGKGGWRGKIIDPEPEPTEDDLLEFLPGSRDMFAADIC